MDDVEAFWTAVEDNLRVGRIRLVFLADRLAPGLVRIIEFLNEQMRDVEVLGIELPQYTAPEGQVVFVPRVVGRTAAAVESKQRSGRRAVWTEQALLDAGDEARSAGEMALVRRLVEDVKARSCRFSWCSGSTVGVTGWYLVDGVDTPVWNMNVGDGTTAGFLYYALPEYASRHPERVEAYADAVAELGELTARVARVRAGGWRGWPSLPLAGAAVRPDEAIAPVVRATR